MRAFRPSLEAAIWLADILNTALSHRFVDKVWRPAPHQLLIRMSGKDKRRLLLTIAPQHISATLCDAWPVTPSKPDQTTIRFRELLEGARIHSCEVTGERGLKWHMSRGGEPLTLTQQLAGRFPNIEALGPDGMNVRLVTNRPGQDPDSPALRGESISEAFSLDTWDAAVQSHLQALALHQAKASLRRGAKAWLKRRKRAVVNVEGDAQRADGAADARRYGELLKTMLGRIKPGAQFVEAVDYTTPNLDTIRIPLDPSLDGRANMARYFKRYKKYHDAKASIAKRLDEAQRAARHAEELLHSLEEAKDLETLQRVERTLRKTGWRPPSPATTQRQKKAPLPYRTFKAHDGSEIWVGRGAKHNDAMTFRHARGHDIWLHARDAAGAHVILRRSSNSEVHPEALIDAAVLAKLHSKAKEEAIADIMWTERKHVRKSKGAPQGQVSVAKSKHFAVRDDPERLRRLYSTEAIGE